MQYITTVLTAPAETLLLYQTALIFLFTFPTLKINLAMDFKTPNGKYRFANILGVGFLAVSLIAVTLTLSDSIKRQLLKSLAVSVEPPTTVYNIPTPSKLPTPTPLRTPTPIPSRTPTPAPIKSPTPTPPTIGGGGGVQFMPIITPSNPQATPVAPCFRACTLDQITLLGQTPGRTGYMYANGNIAGFYKAADGKYYPVNVSANGPTTADLKNLANTINAQRAATSDPNALKTLISLNPTVAKQTQADLTKQCQVEKPPNINCSTSNGLVDYLTYENNMAQTLLLNIKDGKSGGVSPYTDLQLAMDLARLSLYQSRNIISLNDYMNAVSQAQSYLNSTAQNTKPVQSPIDPSKVVQVTGGGKAPPTSTPIDLSKVTQVTGGGTAPKPTPTSTPIDRSKVTQVTGGGTAPIATPIDLSKIIQVTGSTPIKTPIPTPSFVQRVNNAIAQALQSVGLGPTPTPRSTTIPDVRKGISYNPTNNTTTESTTTYLNSSDGLITSTTETTKNATTGQVIDSSSRQTKITQTTYRQDAGGISRIDTIVTTDLNTGKVTGTKTTSTQITNTNSAATTNKLGGITGSAGGIAQSPTQKVSNSIGNIIINAITGLEQITLSNLPQSINNIINLASKPTAPNQTTSSLFGSLISFFNIANSTGTKGTVGNTTGTTESTSKFGNILNNIVNKAPDLSLNQSTSLNNNASAYTLNLESSSVNLNSLPPDFVFKNSFTLNFNSQNGSVTLSFPYGNGQITVTDIKTIEQILGKMGGLSRFLPSLEFIKANNTSGQFISNPILTDPNNITARLVVNLNTSSQFDLAQAISSTLKYGPYGSGKSSELLVAYYNTFYVGKTGTPGNYISAGPVGNSVANSDNTFKDATDDLSYSLAQYLTDPDSLKKRDPERYAFINAVYLGYNPIDIQIANTSGTINPNDLSTNKIIKNYDSQLNQQSQSISNNTWSDIPPDVANNNSRYQSAAENASAKYGVPVGIIVGVMENETGAYANRDTIVSTDGYKSVGVMQVRPGTNRYTPQQLKQADVNIDVGTSILKQIYEDPTLGNGNWRDTIALYNAGDWNTLLNKPIISTGGYTYADSVLIDAGINPSDVTVKP